MSACPMSMPCIVGAPTCPTCKAFIDRNVALQATNRSLRAAAVEALEEVELVQQTCAIRGQLIRALRADLAARDARIAEIVTALAIVGGVPS